MAPGIQVAQIDNGRYAVSVRNALPGRIMGVVSVDGVNVVSGQTAAWHQTGYVLSPWQQYDITGWRKTDHEVAAFHFTTRHVSHRIYRTREGAGRLPGRPLPARPCLPGGNGTPLPASLPPHA